MKYELRGLAHQFKTNGILGLIDSAGLYLRRILDAVRFILTPIPTNPNALVDFVMSQRFLETTQRPSELRQLVALLMIDPPLGNVIEIGTAQGGTLLLWCRLARPDATIISIDLPNGPWGGGCSKWQTAIFKWKFPKRGQHLHCIRVSSQSNETWIRVGKILDNQPADLLFIDGDHTEPGVKSDFNYRQYVGLGGVIAFHDIAANETTGVHRFWSKVKAANPRNHYEFIDADLPFGIGVVIHSK